MCSSVCQKKETHFMFHVIYSVSRQASPCRKRKISVLVFLALIFFSPCVCPLRVPCREVMAVLPHPIRPDACDLMQSNEKEQKGRKKMSRGGGSVLRCGVG